MSDATPLDTSYDPKAIESQWYQNWESKGYFAPTGKGNPFCLMLPPPNVTGSLHMGHAMEASLMDCLIRYHRMMGDNTHWQVGTDHAGIATQMVVERQLAAENKNRHDMGREAFVDAIWSWKKTSGDTISNQFRRLGVSADWERERFTMDEGLSKAVSEVFIQLFDEGLIYRGKRLVNWDTQLKTAVSDLEVEYEDADTSLWHLRYPLMNNPKEYIIVATTRPETLLGDAAVAVHPNDERYKHLIGEMLQLPLTNRSIPVIADEYVDPEFGTGCVKITPAHDFNDYEMGMRHDLPLLTVIDFDGCMNMHAPEAYVGLDRFEARKRIVSDLEAIDLIERIEPYQTKRPKGDRSGTILEPLLTDQWYVKVAPLAEVATEAVKKGDIQFVPKQWENTYFAWMNDVKDWCISRQLWWGHRIPAWYDNEHNVYVGKDEAHVREKYKLAADLPLRQEDDVLDTWFSSALWPFSTLGWPEKTADFETFYPTSVLITGFDIIFFWVARMIMMGYKFTGKPPFKQVYIHGLICDQDGKKMSKSKGNVIDPLDLIDGISLEDLVAKRTGGLMQPQMAKRIEKSTLKDYPEGIPAFGTDAVRFTFCSLASTNRHIQFDLKRVTGYRNFCNKLWNAGRYVLMNLEGVTLPKETSFELSLPDRYIRSKLNRAIQATHEALNTFRFDLAAQTLYEFVWHEFCDWYLELSKPLLQEENAALKMGTQYTLATTLDAILRLLHPFMPFMTEEIWQRTRDIIQCDTDSIMLMPYPVAEEASVDEAAEADIAWMQQLILAIRNIRGEMNISPKQALPVLVKHADAKSKARFEHHATLIARLANIEAPQFMDAQAEIPASASSVLGELELFVPMKGLIDTGAELARIDKQLKKIADEHQKLQQKLSNSAYKDRAPKELIERDEARVEELSGMMDKLKANEARIKAL